METETDTGDIVFSFTQGGRSLRISAWEVATGAVQRTYTCDADGGGSSCCLLGKDYILCALRSLPFICVWNVRMVNGLSDFSLYIGYLPVILPYSQIENTVRLRVDKVTGYTSRSRTIASCYDCRSWSGSDRDIPLVDEVAI